MNNLQNLLLLAARQLRRDFVADNPISCVSFTGEMAGWLFMLSDQLDFSLLTEEEVVRDIRRRSPDWTWSEENEIDFPMLRKLRELAFDS